MNLFAQITDLRIKVRNQNYNCDSRAAQWKSQFKMNQSYFEFLKPASKRIFDLVLKARNQPRTFNLLVPDENDGKEIIGSRVLGKAYCDPDTGKESLTKTRFLCPLSLVTT